MLLGVSFCLVSSNEPLKERKSSPLQKTVCIFEGLIAVTLKQGVIFFSIETFSTVPISFSNANSF